METIIVSDLHLTNAELGRPGRSLWKRYKRPKFFLDPSFRRFIQAVEKDLLKRNPSEKIELILNGDIFDFDSVTTLPPLYPKQNRPFRISWIEKKRGLFPEEDKSAFKMKTILEDHDQWVETLKDFISRGHHVVFVIGNHDVELNWPKVQRLLLEAIAPQEESQSRVRICEWFYISHQDTFIEHSHQYDDYCVTAHPVHPFIKKGKRVMIRLPFGNLTSRYMVNGMGLFNPHAESSFLMSFKEYIRFFYKYSLRVHPWLPITWAWSSMAVFYYAIQEGLLPPMRDPLFTEQRIEEIAKRSNSEPKVVRTLREIHIHPASFNPIKIARELWLDRLVILLLIAFFSLQLFAFLNLFVVVTWVWWVGFFILMLPTLIYYSQHIQSEVESSANEALKQAPFISKITGVNRMVFGHSHRELHELHGNLEILNTGTWSPAFQDPECRIAFGKKCFTWIKSENRTAELHEWLDPGFRKIEMVRKS